MSENPDDVWMRVDAELTRRSESRQMPGSWAELARKLETTEQRLNNWRRRGVPARSYGEIADALGWTVDQVAGRDAVPRQIVVSLFDALRSLGRALSAEMPADVRQDAADLLAKLAMRNGADRHQAELISLLDAVTKPVVVTAQAGGVIDVDRHAGPANRDDGSVPKGGDIQQSSERGMEWAPKDIGKRISTARVAGPEGDHYPGRRKTQKPGKGAA